MKVEKVVRKNEAELKIEGEGHTLLNLLTSTLLRDGNVEFASYDVDPHHSDRATLYIRARDPIEALENALAKISKMCDEFRREFEKAKE